MPRRSLFAAFPSLCFVLLLAPPARACSRELSRQARHILRDVVLSSDTADSMPEDCPFNPKLDRYLEHENHKSGLRRSHWKCGYCGKQFRNEEYMDRHMERRHMDKIPEVRHNEQGDGAGWRSRKREGGSSEKGRGRGQVLRPTRRTVLNTRQRQMVPSSETRWHIVGGTGSLGDTSWRWARV